MREDEYEGEDEKLKEAAREMRETRWQLKKTRMGIPGLY
jgi:hypothetical protein